MPASIYTGHCPRQLSQKHSIDSIWTILCRSGIKRHRKEEKRSQSPTTHPVLFPPWGTCGAFPQPASFPATNTDVVTTWQWAPNMVSWLWGAKLASLDQDTVWFASVQGTSDEDPFQSHHKGCFHELSPAPGKFPWTPLSLTVLDICVHPSRDKTSPSSHKETATDGSQGLMTFVPPLFLHFGGTLKNLRVLSLDYLYTGILEGREQCGLSPSTSQALNSCPLHSWLVVCPQENYFLSLFLNSVTC
jgi:hypothetical protein